MGIDAGATAGYLLSGAGNRFVLVDAIAGDVPADPAELARDWCGRAELALDGLLLLEGAAGALRMIVFNRDGSRPEACGNGLRCLAHHALAAGHVTGDAFTVETDAGPCAVRVVEGVIATCLGVPRVGLVETVSVGDETVELVPVVVGNPHAVVFRAASSDADVERIGAGLQRHPRFVGGVNVELVVASGDAAGAASELVVRVWERGVGETAACGTGAAAVLAAARARLGWGERASVKMAGGTLDVSVDAEGALWVAGPVEVDGKVRG